LRTSGCVTGNSTTSSANRGNLLQINGFPTTPTQPRPHRARPVTLKSTCWRKSGEGEIRTPGWLSPSPVFETGAFNRSATSPGWFQNNNGLAHGGQNSFVCEAFSRVRTRAVGGVGIVARFAGVRRSTSKSVPLGQAGGQAYRRDLVGGRRLFRRRQRRRRRE